MTKNDAPATQAARPSGKHVLLRKQFQSAVESMGQVVLPEDLAIVDEVISSEQHCTVDEIRAKVLPRFPELSIAHVRRTLALLCDLGLATRMQVGENKVYEHIHLDEHHDHFICLRCGRIEEFSDTEIEDLQVRRAAQSGFRPLFHRLEIRGICSTCASGMPAAKTLASAEPGETVIVADLLGGHGFMMRLTEMGLTRGTRVRVLQNAGQVVLEVRGTRLGIGRGMARKIIVSADTDETASGAGR